MKKFFCCAGIMLAAIISVILGLSAIGTIAQAAGLVDDVVNVKNLYSQYPLLNYSLDYYVDSSWDWLPWNWTSGFGKSILYGVYTVTNFIWIVSMYISYATGYVVEEAYKLNFINDMADSIGKNIQILAGINENGIQNRGYYAGFLLLIILILGIYVAYVGLLKREASKAIQSLLNFLVIFILTTVFIAGAPEYIKKINEFSSDVSVATLDLSKDIIIPDSDIKGQESVGVIRDSLFKIQVKQPWILLQFGDSDEAVIGKDRVKKLLSVSPMSDYGRDREKVVKEEIEKKNNSNMTLTGVVTRLGMVFFLTLLNLGISVFVMLLSGHMIFSQILFIVYAMLLPMSFLMSLIPSYNGNIKKIVERLFNTIMMRAGITLVMTITFSISAMFYKISSGYPFFMIGFLQIVLFAGVYFKLNELMGFVGLNSSDAQQMGQRIMRRPYMFMRRHVRYMERRLGRKLFRNGGYYGRHIDRSGLNKSPDIDIRSSQNVQNRQENFDKSTITHTSRANIAERPSVVNGRTNNRPESKGSKDTKPENAGHLMPDKIGGASVERPSVKNTGERLGNKAGAVLDSKNRIRDNVKQVKEKVRDIPVNARYELEKGKEKVRENVIGFKKGVSEERVAREKQRENKGREYRDIVKEKRDTLQQNKKKPDVKRASDRRKEGNILLNGVPYEPTQDKRRKNK